ncbi:MAG: MerR family transcriptional regulator [Dehalococcoidia bacterium]|nr:MerR family transcriptional regulator [Dehalococcoidia bacterium]
MEDAAKASEQTGEKDNAPRKERLLTIGQVVAQLQHDFPDLSITKVRYLEDRGLLAPVRTKGRYRKYGAADIRRLRAILTLQRDEYLPLEVIRQRVERASLTSPGQSSVASGALPAHINLTLRREEPVYNLEELCDASGSTESFVQMLIEYRLIDGPLKSGPSFTESDLETARICQLLARYGMEPRNLRLVASSTEREAAVLEQVATPSLKSSHPDKRDYGEKMLEELGSLVSQLVHLLLYKELRRLL